MAEVLMVLAILAGVAIALLHHLWLIGDRLDDAAARLLWRPPAAQIDTGAASTPGLTPLVEGCDAARTGADRAQAARRLARMLRRFRRCSIRYRTRYWRVIADLPGISQPRVA